MLFARVALVVLLAGGFAVTPLPIDPAAEAATTKKKKTTGKRSDYTPEQRKKITAWAHGFCRKQYGAEARLYRVDYYTKRVWCYVG